MSEQRFGKIVVAGSADQLALAAAAYANQKMPVPVQDLEPHDFRAEFHTRKEFLDAGAIIPGSITKRRPRGIAAYGYTFRNALWVNSDRSRAEQTYVLRHEPFHPIVAAHMTAAKATQLTALVIRVAGTAYQNRLREVLCDAFVELFWGQGSILDDYYGDIADADLKTAWDILAAPEPNPVPPPPEPPPLPLPLPDPQIVELQTQVAQLTQVLDTIHELAAPSEVTA